MLVRQRLAPERQCKQAFFCGVEQFRNLKGLDVVIELPRCGLCFPEGVKDDVRCAGPERDSFGDFVEAKTAPPQRLHGPALDAVKIGDLLCQGKSFEVGVRKLQRLLNQPVYLQSVGFLLFCIGPPEGTRFRVEAKRVFLDRPDLELIDK